MAGYIGSKSSVTLVDGYSEAEADAEFVNDPNGAITVSGSNVGIGTSSPDTGLSVVTGSANGIELGHDSDASTDSARLFFSTSAGSNAIHSSSGSMRFFTGSTVGSSTGTERMRIDSSGQFMFGKTIPTFGNTTAHDGFAINSNKTFHVQSDGASGVNVNRRTSAGDLVTFWYNTSLKGTISTNGSSVSYNTSSDYRLKEDWTPMTGASERVLDLKPVNFAWKEDGSRVDGFLAHELQEVVPEAATGTKDAVMDEEYEVTPAVEATYDEDGNELTAAVEAVMGTRSVPDYQGIDQSKLVPLLTAALQEALTEIASLKTRVEALEA